MEGILVYNGRGNQVEWYKVYFRLEDSYFYTSPCRLFENTAPTSENSKKHFNLGGSKCLIKW